MEAIGIASGIVTALITALGIIWTVVFGQKRNLVDLMRTRRGKQEQTQSDVAVTPIPTHKREQKPPQPSPETRRRKRPLFDQWVLMTGKLVLGAWFSFYDFSFADNDDLTLPVATGFALRFFLIVAPLLLFPGLLCSGVGLMGGSTGSGAAQFGLFCLAGFLAAFVALFFTVGIISLIGLFLAIVPPEAFDDIV